jgi:hypothetical protein
MRRHWFPYILTGLSLALAGLVALAVDWRAAPRPLVPAPAPTITVEEYQTSILSVVEEYKKTEDAARAYQAAILLRVPKDLLQTHLDLVIAWQQLAAGAPDGKTRLELVAIQSPWLQL